MNRKRQSAQTELGISGHETVRPTPDILDALEKDYPLEASIADLVDNSIDAGAKHVLIRFMKSKERLKSLCVVDDGHGMDTATLRRAMQFGSRRKYGAADLGMFGVGLKTASLSQAEVLTVVSRAKRTPATGRQWTKSGIKQRDWSLNIVDRASVEAVLSHRWGPIGAIKVGTVVRWDDVYDFDRLQVGLDAYIGRAITRIQRHLGLKLHRFLEHESLTIQIDVEDTDEAEVGPPSVVGALNPFPTKAQAALSGYPKDFDVKVPRGGSVRLRAHIWRKKSGDEGYKLGGGRVAEHQGFYFYRHDRLIQDGGWNDLIGTNEPHLSLARVEVDIPDGMQSYLKVRSNKAGVDVPASFADAVYSSTGRDGATFKSYLETAEAVYRRKSESKARPMLKPGEGIPAGVTAAIERGPAKFVSGRACSVAWGRLAGSDFIEVDKDKRRIILNARYRSRLLRGAHGGKTDVPIVRTLLYFALENLLAGDRVGAVEKLRLDAIKSSLNAAVKLEQQWAEK